MNSCFYHWSICQLFSFTINWLIICTKIHKSENHFFSEHVFKLLPYSNPSFFFLLETWQQQLFQHQSSCQLISINWLLHVPDNLGLKCSYIVFVYNGDLTSCPNFIVAGVLPLNNRTCKYPIKSYLSLRTNQSFIWSWRQCLRLVDFHLSIK